MPISFDGFVAVPNREMNWIKALCQQKFCDFKHLGLVISSIATVAFEGDNLQELRAGTILYIPPIPHDSQVEGDEPYVFIHLPLIKTGRRFCKGKNY